MEGLVARIQGRKRKLGWWGRPMGRTDGKRIWVESGCRLQAAKEAELQSAAGDKDAFGCWRDMALDGKKVYC